jgi:hypothetical protein
MSDKRMLIVDGELMRKIDENRGEMSRNEFLSFLIISKLEDKETTPSAGSSQYVSRAEYSAFTQDMKDLLRHFFDFFIKDGIKSDEQPGNGDFAELSQKLQALSAAKFKPRNIK